MARIGITAELVEQEPLDISPEAALAERHRDVVDTEDSQPFLGVSTLVDLDDITGVLAAPVRVPILPDLGEQGLAIDRPVHRPSAHGDPGHCELRPR